MRDGGFVSIGWHDHVPDLSEFVGQEKVSTRDRIREWLLPLHASNPGVAARKAGEFHFAEELAENDLVLACEGRQVLGVGRVRGPYEYDSNLEFPHKRPVEWLLLEPWQLPTQEGPRTTVYEIGRNPDNLLELERQLFDRERTPTVVSGTATDATRPSTAQLPTLDPIAERVENILRRKKQVVLYGPPGTGKTYRALRIARELASRQSFRKNFDALTQAEQAEIGPPGLADICTFRPGFGYEDFIEGLRPKTANGNMTFERRDGIFKRLCETAPGSSRPVLLPHNRRNKSR